MRTHFKDARLPGIRGTRTGKAQLPAGKAHVVHVAQGLDGAHAGRAARGHPGAQHHDDESKRGGHGKGRRVDGEGKRNGEISGCTQNTGKLSGNGTEHHGRSGYTQQKTSRNAHDRKRQRLPKHHGANLALARANGRKQAKLAGALGNRNGKGVEDKRCRCNDDDRAHDTRELVQRRPNRTAVGHEQVAQKRTMRGDGGVTPEVRLHECPEVADGGNPLSREVHRVIDLLAHGALRRHEVGVGIGECG